MRTLTMLFVAIVGIAVAARSYADWGLTPGGYRHKSCCHHVPSGSHLVTEASGIVTVYPPNNAASFQIPKCKYPMSKFPGNLKQQKSNSTGNNKPGDVEGWHVYTQQNVAANVFLGSWNVPDLPSNDDGQTLFMFTGVQNINWVPPNPGPDGPFDIIQPVLQYGPSEAGGGSYWTLASWYVPLSNGDSAVWSDLISVNPGDNIFGNMTMVGPSSWYINSYDTTIQQNTDMTITKSILKTQPWAYVTLEVYDIGDCDDYPTVPLNFTNLAMWVGGKAQPFQWQTVTPDNSCNQDIQVVNPSNVIISW